MPPRYLLRGCYRSLSPTPLRGSRGQQPCGAAVSAAMIAPCAGDVLCAAVVVRKPVFIRFRRGGGRWLALAKMPPHHPAHPCSFAAAIASLCRRSLAPRKSAEHRGNTAPRHRRGETPCRKIAKQLPNTKIAENYFFLATPSSGRSAPPGTRTRNQLIKSFTLAGVSA